MAKKLNINGIDEVYAVNYENVHQDFSHLYPTPDTAYIIKDQAGKYVLCTTVFNLPSWNKVYQTLSARYFNDINDFDFEKGQDYLWKVMYNLKSSGVNKYVYNGKSFAHRMTSHAILYEQLPSNFIIGNDDIDNAVSEVYNK